MKTMQVTLPDGQVKTVQVEEGADYGAVAQSVRAGYLQREQAAHAAKREEFYSRVDNTPTPPVKPLGMTPSMDARGSTGMGTQEAPDARRLFANAAEAGVDVRTGAPAEWKFAAGVAGGGRDDRKFSVFEYYAEKAIRDAGLELPNDTPVVYKDPYTNRVAYLRPVTGEDGTVSLKPTLVNGIENTGSTLLEFAPGFVQGVAEAGGSAAGAAVGSRVPGGTTLGAAVGSGSVAAASNMLRQAIARGMGIPDEIVARIKDEDMFRDVLYAAGGDAAFGAGYGLYRAGTNKFRRVIENDPERLAKIRADFNEGLQNLEKLEEVLGIKLTPTLTMMTDDAGMAIMESDIKSVARDSASTAIKQTELENRLTLGTAIRRLNEKEIPAGPMTHDPISHGPKVRDITRSEIQPAQDAVDIATQDLTRGLNDLPKSTFKPWREVQDLAKAEVDDFVTRETVAWNNFLGPRGLSVDPKTGRADIWLANSPQSPIRRSLRRLSANAQQTLAPIYRQAQEKFLRDMGVDETGRKALEEGLPSLVDEAIDPRQLHIFLSYLKQQRNNLDNSLGWTRHDVSTMIEAIEGQINRGAFIYNNAGSVPTRAPYRDGLPRVSDERATEIRQMFREANAATTAKYDFENMKALNQLAEMRRIPGTRDHEFVMQPDAVRNLFFRPGNSNALAELRHLRGLAPETKAGLQRELLATYRAAVTDGEGRFVQAAHDRFVRDYDNHMSILFGDRAGDINNIQRMADEVARYENRLRGVQEAVKDVFGNKFAGETTFPDEVVREIMTGKVSAEQLKNLSRRISRTDPALWQDIKRQGMNWLENYVRSGTSGDEISWKALNRLLSGTNRDKLALLYGRQYVENMELVFDTARRMSRAGLGEAPAHTVQSPLLQVSRSLLGPLSKKQRFITATNKLFKKLGTDGAIQLMREPWALNSFVQLGRATPGSFAAAQLVMEGPGILYDIADDETKALADKIMESRNFQGFRPAEEE